MRGEAQAAASLGVRIFEDARVRNIDAPHPVAKTATGTVTASAVLLVGHACHRRGRGRRRCARLLVSLGITATGPLRDATASAINPQNMAIHDNLFVLDYHRLTADRRLIFGGGTSCSGANVTGGDRTLRPSIEATSSRLKGVAIDYEWFGQDGAIINRIPHLVPDRAEPVPGRGLFRPGHRHLPHRSRDHGGSHHRALGRVRHLRPDPPHPPALWPTGRAKGAGGGTVVLHVARKAAGTGQQPMAGRSAPSPGHCDLSHPIRRTQSLLPRSATRSTGRSGQS